MKSLTRFVIALGAVAMVAISQAQGGPGGGRQGGGRMMMGFGGGMQNSSMLLMREDVQDDLGITSEQRSALRDLQEKQMENMRGRFQRGQGGGGGGTDAEREARRAEMQKLMKENEAEVNKILKPEQTKRLKEIGIQMAGNRAVQNEDVAKDLGITAEQKAKFADLQTKQQEANRAVMERMRNQELDMEQFRATMEKNNKILDEEFGKVLTDAQKTKLKEMGGKPFVRKDDN